MLRHGAVMLLGRTHRVTIGPSYEAIKADSQRVRKLYQRPNGRLAAFPRNQLLYHAQRYPARSASCRTLKPFGRITASSRAASNAWRAAVTVAISYLHCGRPLHKQPYFIMRQKASIMGSATSVTSV